MSLKGKVMHWLTHLNRIGWHDKPHYPKFQDTTLFLTLALWLCTLPVLALVALPFLGWKMTAYLAGGLLVIDLIVCWFVCTFRLVPKSAGESLKRRLSDDKQK